ncbi:MAG: hypothetical protein AAF639_40825 [Chloroflexota bacterium]
MLINPFIYGRSIHSSQFYNHTSLLRRVMRRLESGQETAIIGQPHVGKTSLLNVIMDEAKQREMLGHPLAQTIFRYIDSHMLSQTFTQHEFWNHALEPVSTQIQDPTIQSLYTIAKENHFGTFTLERLFAGLHDAGWKVALLLDEFEAILSHPILNSTEFYGSLRSLASRFDSLAVIIATRRSLDALNVETQKLNPHGSPYFNIFTEQRIGALPPPAANAILDQAGDQFTKDDRDFVLSVSGRHPYLLQLTAAHLWEDEPEQDDDMADEPTSVRYERVAKEVHDQTLAHFNDTWRSWSNAERKVITAIALAQIPFLVDGRDFKWQKLIEDIHDYSSELRTLEKDGTIVRYDHVRDEHGERVWWITQEALLWWLADTIKREVRDDTSWGQWLEANQYGMAGTSAERERFRQMRAEVRQRVGRGGSTLIEAFVKNYV